MKPTWCRGDFGWPKSNAQANQSVFQINLVWCFTRFKVDAFPTVLVFIDGQQFQEYPDAEEPDAMLRYAQNLVDFHTPPASTMVAATVEESQMKSEEVKSESSQIPVVFPILAVAVVATLGLTVFIRHARSNYQQVDTRHLMD